MASATGTNSANGTGGEKPRANGHAYPIQKNSINSNDNGAHSASDKARGAALSGLIEGQIIPRLMVAHSEIERAQSTESRTHQTTIEPAEAARFAPLPLAADADELMQEVQKFLDRGVRIESIFVDLLAPSARRLGQLWESDACDFVDVTMGLWRLQEVMREVSRVTSGSTKGRPNPPSALFSPVPGENHSFGALMVEEVFAQAGWRSEVLLEPQRRELLQIVADHDFDLVGLTVSCDCHSATLKDLITAIRSVSKSPTTKVIIGGRMVNAHPDLVEQCGADGTAADATSALALAERIMEREDRVPPTA